MQAAHRSLRVRRQVVPARMTLLLLFKLFCSRGCGSFPADRAKAASSFFSASASASVQRDDLHSERISAVQLPRFSALPAEKADPLLLQTAPGHRAASIDDIPFKRNDAITIAAPGGDPIRAFQIVGDDHIAEQDWR